MTQRVEEVRRRLNIAQRFDPEIERLLAALAQAEREREETAKFFALQEEELTRVQVALTESQAEVERLKGAVTLADLKFAEASGMIGSLESDLARVRAAAKIRVDHGHNDTCSQEMSAEYACTCGHDMLRAALEGR